MKTPIKLGPDLSLPLDVVTQTLGLLGQRGSGKTHLLCVLCEELIGAGQPVVILDPLGVLYGLRSSKDGKHRGLSVIVLGGDHGDVPLEPTAGKVIADWVVAERRPCILDLSGFRKAEQRRFVTDFAVRLYERNRDPIHLVVDEADLFCPQRPRPDEMAMLGAFEDLVRRGRARGVGLSLATQRPAVIAKDVLTQVGALVTLRITGPQDRSAIEDWIKYHGEKEDRAVVLGSLASLPIGTAWFWSPGWLGILKKVRIRDRDTFDSSCTPKVGAQRVNPQKLAPVNIEALSAQIADTIERAKADDPRELRRRITELEQAIAKQAQKVAAPVTKVVERPAVSEAMASRLEKAVERFHQAGIAAVEACRDVMAAMPSKDSTPHLSPRREPEPRKSANGKAYPAKTFSQSRPSVPSDGGTAGLDRCARAVLAVVAQRAPAPTTANQAAILSGYSVTSSGFANAVSKLRTSGFIEGGRDALRITPPGSEVAGHPGPLPSGQALVDYWKGKLGRCEREILQVLVDAGGALSKPEIADRSGYSQTSSGFANALSKLRTLELAEGYQEMRPAKELL